MKAFQKIYTKITQITKATCSLKATGIGYDELASVDGRLAQVVKIVDDEVTLQVFSGTEGIRTNAEVVFMGKAPSLKVGDQLAGRFFNALANPSTAVLFLKGKRSKLADLPSILFVVNSLLN
jgi:V/A-type H+-transporting ATPase subunit B